MSPRLSFGLATLASALASLWAGLILPIGIMRSKVPDASAALLFDTFLSVSLPALAGGLAFILVASWLFAKGRPVRWWLPPLCAAPLITLFIQGQLLG
jgi:hypothetical protein